MINAVIGALLGSHPTQVSRCLDRVSTRVTVVHA
jgi:hypothetical protein